MKPEIITRGWQWERSQEKTQWVEYFCHNCNYIETYPVINSDGKRCPKCDCGPFVAVGYVRKVREVKEWHGQ